MRLQLSPWDNGSFASKRDIACGITDCANCPPASLHQIGATVHVPTNLVIDTALAADPETDLLGSLSSTNASVEPLRVHKTV